MTQHHMGGGRYCGLNQTLLRYNDLVYMIIIYCGLVWAAVRHCGFAWTLLTCYNLVLTVVK